MASKPFFYIKIVGGWGSASDSTRGAHHVLHTVGEEGDEGKDEFASNFLATPLW